MKFLLSMIICTSVYNVCLDPFPMPEKYNSHYECMIAGYEESIKKAKEIGSKDVNKYGTIIKFFCHQTNDEGEKIILPQPKPKVKTSI
jgi:hypothetical protein